MIVVAQWGNLNRWTYLHQVAVLFSLTNHGRVWPEPLLSISTCYFIYCIRSPSHWLVYLTNLGIFTQSFPEKLVIGNLYFVVLKNVMLYVFVFQYFLSDSFTNRSPQSLSYPGTLDKFSINAGTNC
jgi:hypothetical protein